MAELFSSSERLTFNGNDYRCRRLDNIKCLIALRDIMKGRAKTNNTLNGQIPLKDSPKNPMSVVKTFKEAIEFFEENINVDTQNEKVMYSFGRPESLEQTKALGAVIALLDFVYYSDETVVKILNKFYINELGGKDSIKEVDVRTIYTLYKGVLEGNISKEEFYKEDDKLAENILMFKETLLNAFEEKYPHELEVESNEDGIQ